jgi:hypothetical protein
VAKGFSQIPGVDFTDTFAPVVRLETFRTLMAIAARYRLNIHTMDVVGAYLNGKLDEIIYMEQPHGYEDGTNKVCKLLRPLYGLKQSGAIWNKKLNSEFLNLGFTRLIADQCVYIRRNELGIVIIAVHVDDMTILASDDTLMSQAKAELGSKFDVQDLGPVRQILGMEVTRDLTSGSITLTQTQYLKKILERFGMTNCHPVTTPLDPNVKLEKTPDDTPVTPELWSEYSAAVGSFNFAATTTRPDMKHTVHELSQYLNNPSSTHWSAAKRVLRYISGTLNLGITYSPSDSDPDIYSDANWGTNPIDRKSVSGYAVMFGNTAISWYSKKQPTVALSTMEAEYMAVSNAMRECLWIRELLTKLGIPPQGPTIIHVDNQAAIKFAENSQFHARSKHIDIRHHFIREHITSNEVSVQYCTTDDNIADIFTKFLSKPKHEHFVKLLGMTRVHRS